MKNKQYGFGCLLKPLLSFLVLIFGVVSISFADMPVEFFKEEVSICLGKNTVTVKGLYFFLNNSDFHIDTEISYPFPIDSNHQYPTKIKVLNPRHPIEFTRIKKGLKCMLHLDPNGIRKISIEYSQKIKGNATTYILTSSKFWKKKMDKAMFTIETEEDFPELKISLKPDSVKVENNKTFYFITKRYFLPEKDLNIIW